MPKKSTGMCFCSCQIKSRGTYMIIRRRVRLFVGGALASILLLLLLVSSSTLRQPNTVPVLPTLMQFEDTSGDAATTTGQNGADVVDNSVSEPEDTTSSTGSTVSQPAATPVPGSPISSSNTVSSPVSSAPITVDNTTT